MLLLPIFPKWPFSAFTPQNHVLDSLSFLEKKKTKQKRKEKKKGKRKSTPEVRSNRVQIIHYFTWVQSTDICTLLEYLSVWWIFPTFEQTYLHFVSLPRLIFQV